MKVFAPWFLVVLLSGCGTADWNRLLYGSPSGFTPNAPTHHAPQAVQSNAPNDRITALAYELSQVTPRRWGTINVVVRPDPGYMYTDGPVIYVDPGFASSFTDEELLGALAHEMAHGDLGHLQKKAVVFSVMDLIVRAVASRSTNTTVLQGTNLAGTFVAMQFSQAEEREADRQAVAYLNALGYNGIMVMTNVLNKLTMMEGNSWPSWFATHPTGPERIAALHYQPAKGGLLAIFDEDDEGLPLTVSDQIRARAIKAPKPSINKKPAATITFYSNIQLVGEQAVVSEIEAALALLEKKSSNAFSFVKEQIGTIKQSERDLCSAEKTPAVLEVSKETALRSTTWLAGVIAKEAWVLKEHRQPSIFQAIQQRIDKTIGQKPPDYQRLVMARIGASQEELEAIK